MAVNLFNNHLTSFCSACSEPINIFAQNFTVHDQFYVQNQ